jgi:hypothetical protein
LETGAVSETGRKSLRSIKPSGARLALAALALAATAAGCDRRDAAPVPAPASALDADQAAGEAAYLAPPVVTRVVEVQGGAQLVEGRAPPVSQVQLASPDGEVARTRADAAGAWRLALPPAERPRLYAVSAIAAGHVLHAEGALLLAPGAVSPAVTLRAGAAALPLSPSGGRLDIATVDYDPSGVLAAAGAAPAGASVSLMVDGGPAARGQADAQGRYALLAAGRRLPLGPHRLTVMAAGRAASREVNLTPAAALTSPFAAERLADGWRVEWAPTGGGVQTTLLPGR